MRDVQGYRQAGVAFATLLWTAHAIAQVAPPADKEQVAKAAQKEQDTKGTAQGGEPAQIETVVIVKQRSERLLDVPTSITAVSKEEIERAGSTSLENLTKIVPGAYLQRAVYGLSPTMRGIGSTLSASSGEQNVATYVDGVYQGTPTGNIFDLASVASVDVLKGPQGTLFGRNATGGALLVTTLNPSFKPAGKFKVSYDNLGEARASAYGNTSLTDKIAVNGAVAYRESKGYIHDNRTGQLVNSGENYTVRGKMLFEPTENLSVVLAASRSVFDDPTGSSYQALATTKAFLLPVVDSGPIAFDRFHLSHNTKPVVKTSGNELTAHVNWDLDVGTVTWISAHKTTDLFSINDIDLTYATIQAPVTLPPPLPPIVVAMIPTNQSITIKVDTKVRSHELNFTSKNAGPLKYVAGLYYYGSDTTLPYLLNNATPLSHSEGHISSYAAYADATYDIDQLSLIGGLRRSHENRKQYSAQGSSAPAPYTRIQEATDDQWTPRIGFRYALAPRTNVYATYSQGFKSGVFDASTPTGLSIAPEKLNAYEVGFKSSSNWGSFNAAIFYYDYLQSQVSSTVSGDGGKVFTQLFNVPKSRSQGIEFDGTLKLSKAFDVRTAVAYTDAKYIDFKFAPGYTNNPANSDTAFGLINASIPVDASGKSMVRAPKVSASATFGYHGMLADTYRLDLAVSPYYSSRVYFDFANTMSQEAYVTVDSTATIAVNDRTTISLFGRNLTDKVYYNSASSSILGSAVTFGMPRTVGLSLAHSF